MQYTELIKDNEVWFISDKNDVTHHTLITSLPYPKQNLTGYRVTFCKGQSERYYYAKDYKQAYRAAKLWLFLTRESPCH